MHFGWKRSVREEKMGSYDAQEQGQEEGGQKGSLHALALSVLSPACQCYDPCHLSQRQPKI